MIKLFPYLLEIYSHRVFGGLDTVINSMEDFRENVDFFKDSDLIKV